MKLSKESKNTIERIDLRVRGLTNTTPAIVKISRLFSEMGIPHEYKKVVHTKDTKHTWNKLIIKKGEKEYTGNYLKVKDLELLTSDFAYRKNPYPYIVKINEIINNKLKQK